MKSKVGIFFVVKGQLLYDIASLEEVEQSQDAINFSGHYEYWESLRPKSNLELLFKQHAYDYLPRGRVIYFNKTKSFKLCADRCISTVELDLITTVFQLTSFKLAQDEHYQCATCNPNYLD